MLMTHLMDTDNRRLRKFVTFEVLLTRCHTQGKIKRGRMDSWKENRDGEERKKYERESRQQEFLRT